MISWLVIKLCHAGCICPDGCRHDRPDDRKQPQLAELSSGTDHYDPVQPDPSGPVSYESGSRLVSGGRCAWHYRAGVPWNPCDRWAACGRRTAAAVSCVNHAGIR